jgi:putative addiction module component (TIGR02574 family)
MTELLEKIEREAQRLSRDERERLISNLVSGLYCKPLSEIDQAWIDEAERRYDDLVSGRIKGIPAKEAIAGIRREFGWEK